MKKEKLVLAHPITNELNDKPLSAASETTYGPDWVKIATYMECITAGDYNVATASVGDELEIEVVFPVCCEVGGVFSVTTDYDKWEFITLELLEIIENKGCSADIRVRVVARGNKLSFIKPVSEKEKQRLEENRSYDYIFNEHGVSVEYVYLSDNMIQLIDDSGGGDLIDYDFIYIDDDGIDHLVLKGSEAFEYREAYFGDKVLGYHKYNTIFEHPHILPDGSLSPEIPNRFMKSFRRWVTEKGVLSFMHGVINEKDGVDIYKSMAGEIKVYVYKNGLLFGVDVEGFLYATKTMIEETEEVMNTTEYNEARELYDQLVRKIKSL